ncbi:MAG: hypothetical protein QGF78_02935 [Candidatus Bathyarchaeota archaeon]|nr:hypothetical protein [Candidatus Bathyarchaeota archaeon]
MKTRSLTLLAVLAAVYAVASLLPGFPMIGVPSSKIDLARVLEMGFGFALGPYLGPPTAFLGALVGKTLGGGGFGLFFTPLALVSSLVAACLSRRQVRGVDGWKIAAAVLALLILGWYATPTGRAVPYVPIIHVAGLVIILAFRGMLAEYLGGGDRRLLTLGVALSCYPSTMAGHMLGNLIFIQMFSPDPLFFASVLPIAIIERLVLTAIGTAIAVPLLVVVRQLYPELD